VRALQARGVACVEESARAVIQQSVTQTGVRPSGPAFCDALLARDVAAFHAAGAERTIFDRCLVDAWATARAIGLAPWTPGDLAVRALRLNRRAFIAPPWKSIFRNDAERIQTWEEAVEAFDACAAAYADAGYELIELPLTDPSRRAAFVLDACA